MLESWRCNNDEHINNIDSFECEICGCKRPQILDFYGQEDIDIDKPFILFWETNDATSIHLVYLGRKIDVEPNGSFVIESLLDVKKVTLFVSNRYTSIHQDLSIKIPSPEIQLFYTDKSIVFLNSDNLITWKVKNSQKRTLNDTVELLTSEGKILFKTPVDGKFHLSAENEHCKVTKTILINIAPPCSVIFKSNLSKLAENSSTELTWNIENAKSAKLDTGLEILDVPLVGSKYVSPYKSQTYKIIATALDGVTVFEETTSVTVVKPSKIKEFKSQNKTVFKGEFTRLSWEVENYKDLTISPANLNVTGKTYIMVVPELTTTYILTAKNELHSVSSECTIEVIKKPISWWIPLGAGFFIFLLSAIGWYWDKRNSDLEKIKQIQTLILQGQEIAPNDVGAAKNIFHKVIELNKSLPKDLKVTSMANVAQYLIEEGDKRCNLNVPALKYLAENNYQLAAILTENPNPKTCK